MLSLPRFSSAMVLVVLATSVLARAADDKKENEPTAAQVEFFEKKIRPVLVDKCYACHSHDAKKVKGEYYLDSRDAMRKGGKSGKPAIVPGDIKKSPLLDMIRRDRADEAMPPKEKDALSKEQVKDFEDWVKQGAPDPRKDVPKKKLDGDKKSAQSDPGSKEHWAFRKPVDPTLPAIKNSAWVKSPIDAFVLATLESKDMVPAAQADKRTLIRRAYFDLVGLPPTPEDVATFETDASPDAFAKVVDRLLAMPQYGERWGRYWLDIARYADTKGYVFEEERKYPYAYTYRDYVIRAFNEDLPYDQFLIQQIAADRLNLGDDKRPLAAMGFLTVGRRFLNNPVDIIDDRIDVVTRGTMALTVQCARCHDHKFDPIPIEDYYSLYGVFSSSVEPAQHPAIGAPEQNAVSMAFTAELAKRDAAVEAFLAGKSEELFKSLRSATTVANCLLVGQFLNTPRQDEFSPASFDLNRRLAKKWAEFLIPSKLNHETVFAPWQAYAAIPASEFATRSAEVTTKLFATVDPAKPINPLVAAVFKDMPPTSLREVADRYGALIAAYDSEAAFPEADKEALRLVLHGLYSPINDVKGNRGLFLRGDDLKTLRDLRKKVDELRANDPGAPPAAMVLNDSPTPGDARVLKRGNPGTPGEVAPRRFLECVSTGERKPFTDGSGRLELAKAIASPDNPLTARVMVNRIWQNHFGAALVRTPSDFGVRTEKPVQPELLDWLAVRFIEGGWSIKKLHRTIMLSATWQQSSVAADASYATADPDNTLLYRQNRRRMDFESMRDSYLAVTGQLDSTLGGKAVDIIDPANNRRSIYGFIDRQNLPGMFRTFDFASPDAHSSGRFFTTVPQQALFMLNSPFVERAARQVASREDLASNARVDHIYKMLFGRSPTSDEAADAAAFIEAEDKQTIIPATPWRYGYGTFDSSSNNVTKFVEFDSFTGDRWKPSEPIAKPELTFAFLTAQGGHAGLGRDSSVIRRWTSPADGTVGITGTASHNGEGDGIVARVVSKKSGQLSSWTLLRLSAATNLTGIPVQKGDVIDFVVDCNVNNDFDNFAWAPSVKLTATNVAVAGGTGVIESDAQRDFAGKTAGAMTPWERYVQVLLLSNEFSFVD